MKATVDLIRDIPQLVAEIWQTAAIGAPNPGGEQAQTSRPKAGSKPPVSMALIHALRTDHRGLLAQYRDICHAVKAITDCPTPVDDQADWTQVSEWLLATVSYWQTGGEVEDNIHNQICRIREPLAALAREPRPVEFQCMIYGCQGTIEASTVTTAEGHKLMTPDTCSNGHKVDHAEVARRAARMSDYPLAELGPMLGVPAKTLHDWKARGLIAPIRKRAGVAVYNYEAVYLVAQNLRRVA